MNNEIINFENDLNNNTFDFSKEWNEDSIISGDDDIIIGLNKSNDDADILFDNSFSDEIDDDKILSIINDSEDVKADSLDVAGNEFKPLDENVSDVNQYVSSEPFELDSFFDSIYNGVEGANDLISQINLKKQTLAETEKEINNLKEQIAREKEEFSRYMDSQRNALNSERNQLKEKMELQRIRLSEESEQIKNEATLRSNDLDLREQKLKIEIEKLEMQKANFAKYKEVEEEKIKNSLNRISIEKDELEKERNLTLETIDNSRKEFEIEKEHFERIKQIEESKLKAERDNFNKNCERFKRLVSGLSANFNNMPNS